MIAHGKDGVDISLLDSLRPVEVPNSSCCSPSGTLACMRNLRDHDCVLSVHSTCGFADTEDPPAATILVLVLRHNPSTQPGDYW